MRLELGEITEAQFARIERELLSRIREVREHQRGPAEASGTFRVTGIEASVVDDHTLDDVRRRGLRAR
jgi:hypothetical protein